MIQNFKFVQQAYYVRDAREAAHYWAEHFGAGPFFLNEHIPLDEVVHLGVNGDLDHTSAYGQLGDLMVELVQIHCDNPSVFKGRAYGLHHLACIADDIDEELARLAAAGIPTATTASAGGTRFAFADANKHFGHYIELYQDNQGLRGFYQMIKDMHQDWDGSDPIRTPG